MVQTSPKWWDNARLLKYVDSQAELDKYSSTLDRHSNMSTFDYYYSNRKWLGLLRLAFYYDRFRSHFGFPREYSMYRPGLQIKFACEAAEKVGSEIEFMGPEFDQQTWERLIHETRMNLPEYVLKKF